MIQYRTITINYNYILCITHYTLYQRITIDYQQVEIMYEYISCNEITSKRTK